MAQNDTRRIPKGGFLLHYSGWFMLTHVCYSSLPLPRNFLCNKVLSLKLLVVMITIMPVHFMTAVREMIVDARGGNAYISSECLLNVLINSFIVKAFTHSAHYAFIFLQVRSFPCLPTALSLDSPNDGVVELQRAKLPFGNHVSNGRGECHVGVPLCCSSQTHNKERNEEMDRQAAR